MMDSVTVRVKELKSAMSLFRGVILKRTRIHAISCVHVSGHGGGLVLTATNLEQTVLLKLPVVASEGEFVRTIPFERLAMAVKAVNGAEAVTLAPDGVDSLRIGGAVLEGIPAVDYPALPVDDGTGEFARVVAGELARAIKATAFCLSRDVERHALAGLLLDTTGKGNSLSLVASDGKRLAWRKLRAGKTGKARVVISKNAVRLVLEFATKNPEATVRMAVRRGTEVVFQVGDSAQVFTKQIDGTFPNYKAVMPKLDGDGWVLDRKALEDALLMMEPGMTERSRAVRFTINGSRLELLALAANPRKATAEIPVAGAGELVVALNPDFVAEYLQSLPKGATEVRLRAKDKSTATEWTSAAVKGHVYILMPLSIEM